MRKIKYKAKKCPRCGTKNNYNQKNCSGCGLIFSRVENGSNKIAKGLLLAGKKDEVVLAKMFPKDVSKKKFLLLCGFLGIFGAHNFYVGRFKKAVYMLVCGLISVLCVAIGHIMPFYETFMSFVSVPIGIAVIFWLFDFIDGCLSKYKIPVAVDFVSEVKIDG